MDNAIHRINHYPAWFVLFVLLTLIHWIVIYPVDSVIQPLNNRGLVNKRTLARNVLDLTQVVLSFLSDEVGETSDEVARRRLVSPA